MSISTPQWLLGMLVDVLAKTIFCYLFFFGLSEPPSALAVALCLYGGIVWASVHFTCLLLTDGSLVVFNPPRAMRLALTLLIANMVLLGLLFWSTGFWQRNSFREVLVVATALLAINLLPILVSAAVVRGVRYLRRTGKASASSLSPGWLTIQNNVRARIVFAMLVIVPATLPVAAIAGYIITVICRANYVCQPGDHLIQSEADAIDVAKKRIISEYKFKMDSFGSIPSFLQSLERANGCCSAIQTRTRLLITVWEVVLKAPPDTENRRSATIILSNCGHVFSEGTYLDSD